VAARWGTGGNNTPLVQQPMAFQSWASATNSMNQGVVVPTLDKGKAEGTAVLLPTAPVQVQWASGGWQVENPTAQALRAGAEHNYQFVRHEMAVRRLTPVECERLQGFPDGWTDIKPGGKDTPDSPRYKALGNSMAVPVMAWIGRRIEAHK
jgi:site-specific DNA-cytosine methylase